MILIRDFKLVQQPKTNSLTKMAMIMETLDLIKQQIEENNIILYMKGSPQFPQCGFSARVVEVMTGYDKPFAFVNILEHPEIRSELPKFANWPTFPQLWVKGELVGGCDIVMQMAQQGELEPLITEACSGSDVESD